MCATSDRQLLVEAESIVRAGIPGARPVRVPAGLVMALPLLWGDGDLVVLRLTSQDGRLTLSDDGDLAPGLIASGLDVGAPAWTAALAASGLRYEDATCEISTNLPDLSDLCARAMAMGQALLGLPGLRTTYAQAA
jgi:hypothetical protein